MLTAPVPEPGQLVEVRRRQFVVTDVLVSASPTYVLGLTETAPQHLVALTSIEDDALGEELRVIWELKPGARVREQSALPEPVGFDEPRRLDAFLDAVRWGAVSSADWRILLAPFRSGIELEDYQLDPLVRAGQMPRVNLLIADTAMPHNGYSESFTALLELLDNQRFARGVMPDQAQLGAVMVRRLLSRSYHPARSLQIRLACLSHAIELLSRCFHHLCMRHGRRTKCLG
jgi:hypothetical protein